MRFGASHFFLANERLWTQNQMSVKQKALKRNHLQVQTHLFIGYESAAKTKENKNCALRNEKKKIQNEKEKLFRFPLDDGRHIDKRRVCSCAGARMRICADDGIWKENPLQVLIGTCKCLIHCTQSERREKSTKKEWLKSKSEFFFRTEQSKPSLDTSLLLYFDDDWPNPIESCSKWVTANVVYFLRKIPSEKF